jgi:hypothetical protein
MITRAEKALTVERVIGEGRRRMFYKRPRDRKRPPIYEIMSAHVYRRVPPEERADDLPLEELPGERVPHLVIACYWVGDGYHDRLERFRIEGAALDKMYDDATKDLCLPGGKIFLRQGKPHVVTVQPAAKKIAGGVSITRRRDVAPGQAAGDRTPD